MVSVCEIARSKNSSDISDRCPAESHWVWSKTPVGMVKMINGLEKNSKCLFSIQ